MIKYVPIGQFQPDAPRYGSDAMDHAENLVPSFGGYRSLRQKATKSFNLAPASNKAINGAMAHIYLEETTAQKERPSGVEGTPDFFRSNSEYTQEDLHLLVDGVLPGDTEYIVAGGGETGQIELLMPEFDTPASAPNWVVRIRWRVDAHETGTHSITYTLLDGASVLAGPTTVTSSTDADSGGWETYEDTFTGNVAWNMSDLRIQIDTIVDGSDALFYPQSDDSNSGAWITQAGSTSNLYATLDEAVTDDADYIRSPKLSSTSVTPEVTFLMEDIEEPFAFFDVAHSPAPFLSNYRVRVPHDNVVPTYRFENPDGTTLKEGEFALSNSGSFSAQSSALSIANTTGYSGMKLALGAYITDEWKNAEGTTGVAEPDRFTNYFPTTDDITGTGETSDFTGDFSDVDDVAGDGDFITYVGQPPSIIVGQRRRINLSFGDYEYPGIDFGSTLNLRWRKDASGGDAFIKVELLDGVSVVYTDTFQLSSSSYSTETIALNTSAIMSGLASAGSDLILRVENVTTENTFYLSSAYINSPESARAEFSRAYVDIRPDARASVSWVEMEVPSSSTGYIDDLVEIYAGDQSDLYLVESTGFTDLSGTTYASGTDLTRPWDFASWGNDVIATNYVDPVQIRTDGSGNFADMITSTNVPKARFVAAVRNQVFLGHCEGDGGTVDMVWWSGIDDASDFDPSISTQSDFQRLRDTPGQITGLVGGQYATIFKRHSIYRADYVGLPVIFDFRLVSEGIGTPYPRSIVQVGSDIYFYTGSGFAVVRNGSSVNLIGDESVSRFIADLDFSEYALRVEEESQDVFEDLAMFGAYDPNSRLIFWFFSGANGYMFEDDTSPASIRNVVYNDVAVHDTRTGRWGFLNLLRGATREDDVANATAAINLFKPSISQTSWTRGLGVFGWDNGTDHGAASGMAQTYFQFDNEDIYSSEAETKIFTVEDGKDITVNRIRPVYTAIPEESASPSVTVTLKSGADPLLLEQKREVAYSDQDSDGWYLGRNSGEFFQLKLEFEPSNNEFIREIQGFQIDFEITGERGG